MPKSITADCHERVFAISSFFSSPRGSAGRKWRRGLGDLQVAAGAGEHDPLGRLVSSARNGK
jgi:hypothetical protein